ncbi:hypothetical protein DUNSADRAFT_1521 [Dunaliella salina]|uniref:Uncharacterized protein n=1 Tax=Dunaliella salina TaxID=3046 RepID=A0ABQ7GWY5_DUNSA|nr:hypothetical protein DUNSADRAFT_1521 [Dunaliella salina]|eukprot:KAF5839123.1 hypothetical protein DUNSADRAFT_1521 [Dunaliella salina]
MPTHTSGSGSSKSKRVASPQRAARHHEAEHKKTRESGQQPVMEVGPGGAVSGPGTDKVPDTRRAEEWADKQQSAHANKSASG